MLTGKISVDKDRRYSVKETCALLKMSPKTLRKYTKAGEITPEVHKITGQLFYKGSSIEDFFNCTI